MTVEYIAIDQIKPHPDNPRLFLRQEVIDGIAAQIEASGEFDPAHALLVRPVNGHYQILRGHHRIEGAKKAGLEIVPCWIREMGDDEAYMQLALSNVQGELSPLEIGIHALGAIELVAGGRGIQGGLSEYARQLSQSQSNITVYRHAALVLLQIKPICQHIGFKDILKKAQHLAAIHKAPQDLWPLLVNELLSREWSVKETEEAVKQVKDVTDLIPEWWPIDRTSVTQLALGNEAKSLKAMLKEVKALESGFETVTLYQLTATDTTESRDGREYCLWNSQPCPYDPGEVFRARIKALPSIPNKSDILALQSDILNYIQSHASPQELWQPVLTDEEHEADRRRQAQLLRLGLKDRYAPLVYRGDVLEQFRRINSESIDLIATDPPYNIGKAEWDEWESAEAYLTWAKDWLEQCHRVLKPTGSFYMFGRFIMLRYLSTIAEELGFTLQRDITWDTIQGSGGAGLWPIRHEMILFFTKGEDGYYQAPEAVKLERHEEHVREYKGVEYTFKSPSTVWRFPCVDNQADDRTSHPTQKPVEIMERIIAASCPPDGLVLDPFLGSGTTSVAAIKLRRRSIGIEQESKYIEIARARFDEVEYRSE